MFLLREIAGWLFIALALFLFLLCLSLVGEQQVIEAGIIAGIGIFLFRGGIHLIKVATAGRVLSLTKKDASADAQRLRSKRI